MKLRSMLFASLMGVNLLLGYEINFKADSLHGALGDIIRFSWDIKHDGDLEASLGKLDLEGSGIEVLSHVLTPNKTGSELLFNAAVYDSVGYYQFPAFPVYLQGENSEDSLELSGPLIEIVSILTPADTNFHDIKGLHRISTGINLIAVLMILASLILAYVIYYLIKRYRNRQSENNSITIIAPDEAHVIALRDLKALQESKFLKYGQFKEYHSELTHILKQYYENRYLIDAPEQTSSELVAIMKSMNEFGEDMIEVTGKLLTTADLIKFAKRASSEVESSQALNRVVEIVNSTKINIVSDEVHN